MKCRIHYQRLKRYDKLVNTSDPELKMMELKLLRFLMYRASLKSVQVWENWIFFVKVNYFEMTTNKSMLLLKCEPKFCTITLKISRNHQFQKISRNNIYRCIIYQKWRCGSCREIKYSECEEIRSYSPIPSLRIVGESVWNRKAQFHVLYVTLKSYPLFLENFVLKLREIRYTWYYDFKR